MQRSILPEVVAQQNHLTESLIGSEIHILRHHSILTQTDPIHSQGFKRYKNLTDCKVIDYGASSLLRCYCKTQSSKNKRRQQPTVFMETQCSKDLDKCSYSSQWLSDCDKGSIFFYYSRVALSRNEK